MKALGAIVGILVVGIVGALLLIPRFRSEARSVPPSATRESEPEFDGNRPPMPARSVELPTTPAQKVREDLTRERLPFFQHLRNNYGKQISSFGVTDTIDTLDIVVTDPDTNMIQSLIGQAISPTADRYGFRKVRVYIANPPGALEPLKLVAESTYDGAGRWNTFLK